MLLQVAEVFTLLTCRKNCNTMTSAVEVGLRGLPAVAFYFCVLAQHVEAELFGELQVKDECLITCWSVQAIWPEALRGIRL